MLQFPPDVHATCNAFYVPVTHCVALGEYFHLRDPPGGVTNRPEVPPGSHLDHTATRVSLEDFHPAVVTEKVGPSLYVRRNPHDLFNRRVDIDFDANVATNSSVQAARRGLADELQSRRAQVSYVNIPIEARVNGIDDLLAVWGPRRVLELFKNAEPHHLLLAPNDPMRIARTLIAQRYLQKGVRTIHYHEDTFYIYTGTHYREVKNSEIRSAIYKFLEGAKRRSK